jgi:peptidoglycan/LPS O-acetylase OafA/YrhL
MGRLASVSSIRTIHARPAPFMIVRKVVCVHPTRTLAPILKRGHNNFHLLRLFAALMVVFGHAFALHPTGSRIEPILAAVDFTYSGSIAVYVFFLLSGILVTQSFCRPRTWLRFVVLRFGRIWPGLIVCLALTTFVLGPIVTSLASIEYLTSWSTRRYFMENAALLLDRSTLPGVFTANHAGPTVNGPLWTLPSEVACYAACLLLGVIGCWSNLKTALATAAVLVVGYFIGPVRLSVLEALPPVFFLVGVLCYVSRDHLPIDGCVSIAAFVAWLMAGPSIMGQIAFYAFIVNSALWLAASPALRRFEPPGDYCYGLRMGRRSGGRAVSS